MGDVFGHSKHLWPCVMPKIRYVLYMCISLLKLSLHTQVIYFSQVLTRLAISKYGTLAAVKWQANK